MSEKKPIGGSLLVLLAVAFNICSEAHVLRVLWGWFVVPLGAPVISGAHAYGIAVLLMMAQLRFTKDTDDTEEEKVKRATWLAFAPWTILLMGYVCHRIMLP